MPGTSLALLSWSEQVSPPHTRCSKGSPLGEAPISCYSYPHLPHGTLPARNSPSSLMHSHTTSFGNRFSVTPAWGTRAQKLCPPPRQPQTSKQGSWGPAAIPLCPEEPTLLHPLAFRDAQPQSCSFPRAELPGGKSGLQTTGLDQTQIHKPKGA